MSKIMYRSLKVLSLLDFAYGWFWEGKLIPGLIAGALQGFCEYEITMPKIKIL